MITKSTVPVGTADKVRDAVSAALAERGASIEFDTVSNPEFLKEGAAIADFMKPDRVVVGTDSARAAELMRALYEPFTRNRDRMIVMDVRSAELTKYAANAMLATKISFMNELANLAERFGADIEAVRIGIGSDPRIGHAFIYPGVGYGGSCFPKDVKALKRSADEVGYEASILAAVEAVNERQKTVLFAQDQGAFRRAPRQDHRALGARVQAQHRRHARGAEPGAHGSAVAGGRQGARLRPGGDAGMRPHLRRARRPHPVQDEPGGRSTGADALAIVTEWQEFRSPDFDYIKARAEIAGDLRRPQPLRSGATWRATASAIMRSAAASGPGMSPWMTTLIPVILSGGAGTRLWPLSREMYPKQLLALTGKRHHAAGDRRCGSRASRAPRAPDHRLQRGASLHGRRAARARWAIDAGAPSCSSPSAATPLRRWRSPPCKP